MKTVVTVRRVALQVVDWPCSKLRSYYRARMLLYRHPFLLGPCAVSPVTVIMTFKD